MFYPWGKYKLICSNNFTRTGFVLLGVLWTGLIVMIEPVHFSILNFYSSYYKRQQVTYYLTYTPVYELMEMLQIDNISRYMQQKKLQNYSICL